jgi:hypothetical protein
VVLQWCYSGGDDDEDDGGVELAKEEVQL